MNKNTIYIVLAFLSFAFIQCNPDNSQTSVITDGAENTLANEPETIQGKPVTVKGTIKDGGGLKIHFDRITFDAIEGIDNLTMESNGDFSYTLEEVLPGPYRMRIGKKEIILLLEGNEGEVDIDASLSKIDDLDYTISNSQNTIALIDFYKEYRKVKPNIKDEKSFSDFIFNYIDTTQYPLVGLTLAAFNFDARKHPYATLPLERIVEIHQRANSKYKEKYPGSDLLPIQAQMIAQWQTKISQQPVRVGSVPPDISLQSPNGQTYTLSSLKGKVVLLDFWASWCRPCRMTNPELVRIYNKYKGQDFTVYSVSLDNNAQRWNTAIFKDNLSWEYHVSDLKGWQSSAAALYKVSSIPQTFLIDKDGKVAATNLFPGPQLDDAIANLL